MKKKIGPLEAWQWGLIVLTMAAAYYLYKRNQSAASAVVTPQPTTTPDPAQSGTDSSAGAGSSGAPDPNLIDAGTGQPLLGEINTSLQGIQTGLEGLTSSENALATAFASLQANMPAGGGAAGSVPAPQITVDLTSPAGNGNHGTTVAQATKKPGLTKAEKAAKAAAARAKAAGHAVQAIGSSVASGGHTNPGHVVHSTPKGSSAATHYASSTAQSHAKAVAPPSHQKAPEPPHIFHPHIPAVHNKPVASPHPALDDNVLRLPAIAMPFYTQGPTLTGGPGSGPPPPPTHSTGTPVNKPPAKKQPVTHTKARIF